MPSAVGPGVRVSHGQPTRFPFQKPLRLFLEIPYRYFGKMSRYRPDFIVRLKWGDTLLLEGKGRPDEKDDAKATAARRWIEAVNTWGKLGRWHHAICNKRSEVGAAIKGATSDVAAVG